MTSCRASDQRQRYSKKELLSIHQFGEYICYGNTIDCVSISLDHKKNSNLLVSLWQLSICIYSIMLLACYIWRSVCHWINLFDYYQFSLWWEHLGNRFGAEWSLWRSSLKFELNLTPFKKRMIMSHNIFLVILWLSAHNAWRANTRQYHCQQHVSPFHDLQPSWSHV